jgi:hypothetical protein
LTRAASGMPRLDQLAVISGMAVSDYAQKHSMRPSFQVAAMIGNDGVLDTHERTRNGQRPGMSFKAGRAYCCEQCIAEDLQQSAFSWYRRCHQLVGVDWCVVHGSRLSVVDAPSPFECLPHTWLLKERQLPKSGFLRRFASISTMLLQRERPFLLNCIHGTFAKRAWDLGLRPGRYGNRPNISDHLSAQVERAWLEAHVQGWVKKKPFSFFNRIDSVVDVTKRPAAGEAYVMAMAALYETATAAIFDVSSSEALYKYQESDRASRWPHYWTSQFEKQYPRYNGQLEALAKGLGLHPSTLRDVFSVFGLPNIQEREPSKTWAALIRFSFGERFSSACVREQVGQDEVKELLQRCSGHVMLTIRMLRKEYLTRGNPPRGKEIFLVFPPPVV